MTEFPNPAVLAMNLVRYIGDAVSESGKPIRHIFGFADAIGATSEEIADQLMRELSERDIVRMSEPRSTSGGGHFWNVNLSLSGWEQYEAENAGRSVGIRASSR